jgi:NAD(P)H-dependent FMN reductase
MPTLQIIIASTRPGRVGEPVGQWFVQRARAHGTFDVVVTDLTELGLPFLDEPKHPRLQQYAHQHTRDWSATVAASDAFVLVTPEYNHSFNAPLKNALDFLHVEWQDKPVGFVSYGGVSGGTRSVQALKSVVSALRMMPVVAAVNLPFVAKLIDDDGVLHPSEVSEQAATDLLDELARVCPALGVLRTA